MGQGAWVGLFKWYAPVGNPRLAVVVITRGTDAHGHLPAAIAGSIYRGLSPRFGTQINLPIAQTSDDETPNPKGNKKAAALNEEDAETRAATQAEENADTGMANPDKPAEKVNGASAAETNSKLKTTVMPIESKPKSGQSGPAQKAAPPTAFKAKDKGDARPRRARPA